MQKPSKTNSHLNIFFVPITVIFSGGLIEALTNMINGAVSPYYFKMIMGWDFENIWQASIAQGIFEGLVYGIIFSIIFTLSLGVITKAQASFIFAFQQLMRLVTIVLACWIIGGVVGISLSILSQDFYRAHFLYVPTDKIEMIKYAWVGGSIWGEIIGGLISTILGIVVINKSWLKAKKVELH